MNRSDVSWDGSPSPVTVVGGWKVGILFEPVRGEAPGGDRFALRAAASNLAFYLADATGHGRKGAHFWERFGDIFFDAWERFASKPSEGRLVQFASELNDTLYWRQLDGDAASSSQLCLAAGWVSLDGSLVFASFGLGVHVVPVTTAGPWRMRPRDCFGFRFGWVSSQDWSQIDRALVIHRISDVRRLWLASDASFGDDHADPEGAFRRVCELGEAIAGLRLEDALSQVSLVPHSGDDATFVLLEAGGGGS